MKSRAVTHRMFLWVFLLPTLLISSFLVSSTLAASAIARDVSADETPTFGLAVDDGKGESDTDTITLPIAAPGGLGDLLTPADRIPTWDPGVRGGIPNVPTKVNVRDFGAKGDGRTDDTQALKNAINACPKPGAVYMPEGSYVIRGRIDIPSGIVLRGAGIKKTRILATPLDGQHTFRVVGNKGGSVHLTSTSPKGTKQVSVANASPFTVGQTVELEMDNESYMINMLPGPARGQIVKITAISGNTLTFDVPLRLEYPLNSNPRIYPLTPKQNIGFEDFHVKHVSSDGDNSIIFYFYVTENCWIKNIESEFCARYHINLSHSRHVTVRDSVIHHAYNYSGGGHGYGVVTELGHTSDCLITNSVFYMLRHSLILQVGSNGNVFSYNFSASDNSQGDQIGLTDVDLHGNYSYMDLLEGNVIQWGMIGGYWGQSGPNNTLFRERMIKAPYSKPTNIYRAGLEINTTGSPAHDQNIIGNTLFGRLYNNNGYSHQYDYARRLWIEKNLICRDGIAGDVSGSTVIDNITNCNQAASWSLPYSLYLSGKPDFWGDLPWPAIGADIDSQRMAAGLSLHRIPAQIRYEQIMGLVPTPEPSPTNTPAATNTPLPTSTPTPTATNSPTNTPLPTYTPTFVPANTPTPTPTSTPTPTATPASIPSPTDTPTPMNTPTPTMTSTPLPTSKPTFVPTDTPSPTPASTPTPPSTETPLPTFTPTATSTSMLTSRLTPTTTGAPLPTHTPTFVPADTPTPTPTSTPTPAATEAPLPTFTPTATSTSVLTSRSTPTTTSTPLPTSTPTFVSTDTPTPAPTSTPTATLTETPLPTFTPTVTNTPTRRPTPTLDAT